MDNFLALHCVRSSVASTFITSQKVDYRFVLVKEKMLYYCSEQTKNNTSVIQSKPLTSKKYMFCARLKCLVPSTITSLNFDK